MIAPDDRTLSPVARQFLKLHMARPIGPICVQALLEHFGSIDAVLDASRSALEQVEGVGRVRAEAIALARSDDAADREIEQAAARNVRILCWDDPDYPKLLRHISDPPICLFVNGELRPEDDLAVAVVGSRRCTQYGREQAHRFASLLAGTGFTIVSGLARGADAAAHRGALDGGGRTVAVLGCGLNRLYPDDHVELAERIRAKGALVSSLPMDTAPDASNFPPRNRIIVGMSLGVIVAEAAKKSGALISARLGNEYNREVFAVPGRLDNPYAQGTNALIRDGGAKLITSLEDILDELGEVGALLRPPAESTASDPSDTPLFAPDVRLDETERAIMDVIADEDTPLHAICDRTELSPAAIAAALTRLQLKSLVIQKPGNLFGRRPART